MIKVTKMKRSIKFRGQREDTKEWVYGSLIEDKYIVGNVIDWNEDYFNTEYWWRVIPKTVGQLIGRQDMNKNDVYQGDILSTTKRDVIFIVIWNSTTCSFMFISSLTGHSFDIDESLNRSEERRVG